MKKATIGFWRALTLAMLLSPFFRLAAEVRPAKMFFAAVQKGVICGFGEVEIAAQAQEGRERMVITEERLSRVSLLGVEFDVRFHSRFLVDPLTGSFLSYESEIYQGQAHVVTSATVNKRVIRFTRKPGKGPREISLVDGVVLENGYFYPYLLADFLKTGRRRQSYRVFDINAVEIHQKQYRIQALTDIILAERPYHALVVDELDRRTGAKVRFWLDRESGFLLMAEYPRRTIFLAEPALKDKLASVVMDDGYFTPAGKAISDPAGVTYMKVAAEMEPEGAWITERSLNVPGQRFSGTVKENAISGTFTISRENYDGRNAPPIQMSAGHDPKLRPFLLAEEMIEAADPVIIAKAHEITAGAADSWQAARRLSRWVGENIVYSIEGGISARDTLDKKLGECGAHSLLLAGLCRAAGIPARVVWGCIYLPDRGGCFGQHAWNEVYMGRAGWIAVDSTTYQYDYVDATHLRLGVLSAAGARYQPKKFTILEYRLAKASPLGGQEAGVAAEYQPFLGEYVASYDAYYNVPFRIIMHNGGLALDGLNKMVFELKNADPEDNWFFKLTDQASISFGRDAAGQVAGLTLTTRITLPRKAEEASMAADVPANLAPYIGRYVIPMENRELSVLFRDGGLALNDPGAELAPL